MNNPYFLSLAPVQPSAKLVIAQGDPTAERQYWPISNESELTPTMVSDQPSMLFDIGLDGQALNTRRQV